MDDKKDNFSRADLFLACQRTGPETRERFVRALGGIIEKNGLSVRSVSIDLGLSPPTVHSWLNGETLPTGLSLYTLVLFLRQWEARDAEEFLAYMSAPFRDGDK